jgi:hypothetical protein
MISYNTIWPHLQQEAISSGSGSVQIWSFLCFLVQYAGLRAMVVLVALVLFIVVVKVEWSEPVVTVVVFRSLLV